MPYKTILTWPNNRLFRKCKPIQGFDESLKKLAQNLIDTCNVELGAGLAAPQIGVSKQVVVIRLSSIGIENPDPCELNEKFLLLINPTLTLGDDKIEWTESCLSLPGVSGKVSRSAEAIVSYRDINGNQKSLVTEWPLSGIIQHECDHLEGKLYLHKLSKGKKISLMNKIAKRNKIKLRNERKLRKSQKEKRNA